MQNRYTKIIMFIIIIINTNILFANYNDIGSIFIGTHILEKSNFPIYNYGSHMGDCYVNNVGIAFGIILPIKISSLTIDYKVKIAHHTIDRFEYEQGYYFESSLDKYSTGQNAILVGKCIDIDNKNMILPQLGFGFTVETLWENIEIGRIYNQFFIDFSVQYLYKKENYNVGLIANFETGFLPGFDDYDPLNRFNLCLQFSK